MLASWTSPLVIAVLAIVAVVALLGFAIRQRQMQLWLPSYLWPRREEKAARRDAARRVRVSLISDHSDSKTEPVDVFLAICDHFEPR